MTVLDGTTADAQVQRRDPQLGRLVLTLLAAALVGVGWLAGRTVTAVLHGTAWCLTAVTIGWRQARPPQQRPPGV